MSRNLHSISVILSALLLVLLVTEITSQKRWDNTAPPVSGRDALQYLSSSTSFAALNEEQEKQRDSEYTDAGFRRYDNGDYRASSWSSSSIPPPPPPPPPRPPGGTFTDGHRPRYNNPIHYNFENVAHKKKPPSQPPSDVASTAVEAEEVDRIPQTLDVSPPAVVDPQEAFDADTTTTTLPRYASPRRDAVTRYMSNSKGRALLFGSSAAAGAMLCGALGKSLFNNNHNHTTLWAVIGALTFGLAFFLRNPYGELVRALGLTLLWALERSYSVRRRYPTAVHLKAVIGAGPRRPFPPNNNNPWTYQPYNNNVDDDDFGADNNPQARSSTSVEFNMLYSMIAMAFVGSTVGGNLPLIPTWLGALLGAASFAYSTTLLNARGDLARTMGMRVVALGGQVVDINRELQLLRKMAVVSGRLLDKILILDRQHRIKERIIAGANFLYDQASRQVQNQQQGGDDDERRRRRGPNGDDRRDEYERRRGGYDRRGEYDRRRRRDEERSRDERADPYERREFREDRNERGRPRDDREYRYGRRREPDEQDDVGRPRRREDDNTRGDRDSTLNEPTNSESRQGRDGDEEVTDGRSSWWSSR